MKSLVEVSRQGAVVTLSLNRPEKRNALSLAMREQLVDSLKECMHDDRCRSVVLTGNGAAFCAGADLSETTGGTRHSSEFRLHRLRILQDVSKTIIEAPKPVIAAVNGAAYGAGMSVAIACDIVIASTAAKFCAVFGRVGLLPDAGMLWVLPRRIGYGNARSLLLTTKVLSAEQACGIGLADEVARGDELMSRAQAAAEECSVSAPKAVKAIKTGLAGDMTLIEMFDYEASQQLDLSDSRESADARSAFLRKQVKDSAGD